MTGTTVILALAFGSGQLINYPLKREVEKLSNLKGYPVYTQHDLGVILELNSGISLLMAHQDGDHISSLAIIKQFAQVAKMNHWNSVKLIVAKQHLWRCSRDLKKVLSSVYVQEIGVEMAYLQDLQPWVTSPLRWWTRELIIRVLPWSLYKRLCR
jgi:hypothetical protein